MRRNVNRRSRAYDLGQSVVYLAFALVLFAGSVHAGELDTARQFFFRTRDMLGEVGFTQYDTSAEMLTALNAGLRAVSTEIGIVGYDTVTISANTFVYTLNTNFMEKGLAHLPYKALMVTNDGKIIHGVAQKEPNDFGLTASGTSQESYGPYVTGWCISGNQLWIYPAIPVGAKIYLSGPIEATPFSHGASLETVVPETDRIAAVYYAVVLLATSRPTAENQALAMRYWELWNQHVQSRRGDYTRKVTNAQTN